MCQNDGEDGGRSDVSAEGAAYASRDDDLRDFYYFDGLTPQVVVEDIYRRYLAGKWFTYFGNLLFYIMPDGGTNLQDDYSKHLFEEHKVSPHLFALLNEVLRVTVVTKPHESPQLNSNERVTEVTARSITRKFTQQVAPRQCCNIFVYGDTSFGQMDVARNAAIYLAQRAHVLGLEPTGLVSEQITTVNKLLDMFSDYGSHDRLYRNMMMTYRLDFDSNNQLTSVNLVPNLATDTSCATVAANYRNYVETRKTEPAISGVIIRPPSIVYALLYSIEGGKYRKWLTACRMTPPDARKVLDIIPKHEIQDPGKHVGALEQAIRLLLKIGFGADEVRSIMQILAAVVLFDVYTIVRARIDEAAKQQADSEGNVTNNQSRRSIKRESIRDSNDDLLNPKDILVFAAEVLDIALLRVPPKTLQSSDLLFRLDILGAGNRWQFENIAPALFIRLKLAIYRRANRFLLNQRSGPPSSSIAIHCNAGNLPQSLSIRQHGDVELSRRASEEAFIHRFSTSMDGVHNTATPTADFVGRTAAATKMLAGETGLLANIVIAAQNRSKDSRSDPSLELGDLRIVKHSWHDVEYDIASVTKDEGAMFALPEKVSKLLAYSSNQFIIDIMISSASKRTVYGPCAVALSYITFLKESISRDDIIYHVVCTSPKLGSMLYQKDSDDAIEKTKNQESGDAEEEMKYGVELLNRALSTNMPVVDLCITQREYSQVTLDLEVALNTFLPIAYMALQPSMHRTIPVLEAQEVFRLMLHALKVPESAYRITSETATLKRALCVKLIARVSRYLNGVRYSVRVIQSWWVGYNTIQLKRVLRRVVVRLQSRVRQLIFRERVVALANARNLSVDFIGYCLVLYHLKESLQSSSHKTLQLLHSMEKRYHEKEYHYIQHAAATYIQAVWRGRVERKKYAQMKHSHFEDFAVILVQATIRRFLATATLVNKKPTKDIAATRIQAAFRGYMARRHYEVLTGLKISLLSIVRKGSMLISLSEQLKFVKERKKLNSATIEIKRLIMMQTNLPPGFIKAQNMIRMHFVRRQYLHLKGAIDKVQAIAMTKLARLEYLNKVKSAVKIQRWWRGVRRPSVAPISSNALYYLNIREHAASSPLRRLCELMGVTLFHFRAYQDLRNVYPRSWATYPITLLSHMLQVQRTLAETGNGECPKMDRLQFAIGAYHSLMLVSYSKGGGTALYSWGGPNVLHVEAESAKNAHSIYMEKPLEFYRLEAPDSAPHGRHQLVPMSQVEIVSIACGNEFSLALDREGRLFSWGNNRHGQCGQGHRLVNVWSPTLLPVHGVTGIWCGEDHAVIRLSVGEYFVFGRAFGYAIYAPEDIKAHCEAIRHQRIEAVACGGSLTVLYTAELNYVLRVLGGEPVFGQCYNLRGNIKSVCTNGRMICALVEEKDEMGSTNQRVLAWGQLRCFSRHFKDPLPNTALLVNAFCEMFEHPERRKPRRSLIKVDSCLAKPCVLPLPTPINLTRRVMSLSCDHQQLVMTCSKGVVLAVQTFELIHNSASDIRDSDDHCIRLDPGVTNVQLDPGLYQFTAVERVAAPVQLAYNRLSCSVGYVATTAPDDVQ
ncbi:myosin head domain-containing protein, putative [Babesia ovis]|uniref:Myosin head domain-containing protein, putative n=1 Tax=Babesia ovis TaxID=5869 RepID=A0A9W5T977_BABOV|nr:myosin head domain-containing protein, putative [Babesia ovis]